MLESLLLLAAWAAQTPTPTPKPYQPADALVAGRVIDGTTGKLVTDVVVTLVMRPGPGAPPIPNRAQAELGGVAAPPLRVLVDAGGRFVFTALAAGTFEVSGTKRGYVSGGYGKLRADGAGVPFVLGQSERRTDVTVRVWKHASIAGTVVDEANEPVVGVSVYALRREWVGGELRLNTIISGATTDDRGAYRLGSLLPGDYLVAVPSTQDTVPAAALETVTSNPSAPADIRTAVGTVASLPMPFGSRDVQRVGDYALHGRARSVVLPDPTADGRVMVYPTAYLPDAPGAVNTTPLLALAGGEARAVPPIRLKPATSVRVSGVVTGPDGPASSFTLVLVPATTDGFASEHGFEAARTVTNTSGEYTFLGVTPGVYRLRGYTSTSPIPPPGLAAPGYVPPAPGTLMWMGETVTVGARDVTLALTVRPSLTVSGHLVFEGQRAQPRPEQMARGIVMLARADGRQLRDLGGRDGGAPQAGGFRFVEVVAGRYVIRTAAPIGWSLKSIVRAGQDAIDVPFDLTEDTSDVVVTFTDRQTSIRGAARTAAGTPDAEALVIVFPVTPQRWIDAGRAPIRLRTARTGPTGAYNFAGLPPGDYFIASVHDGSASTWQTPKFLGDLSRHATRIRLDEGGTITQDLKRAEVK